MLSFKFGAARSGVVIAVLIDRRSFGRRGRFGL